MVKKLWTVQVQIPRCYSNIIHSKDMSNELHESAVSVRSKTRKMSHNRGPHGIMLFSAFRSCTVARCVAYQTHIAAGEKFQRFSGGSAEVPSPQRDDEYHIISYLIL